MFLKAFLVFSCLVLYTTSNPVSTKQKIHQMQNFLPKINCSNSFIQNINFTRKGNLCTTRRDMFCQISKALNDSSCTERNLQNLQRHSEHIQGKANCTMLDNGKKTDMEEFLTNLKSYLTSLINYCP